MVVNRKINIAFTLIASKSWMGGFNYLLNLLTGLARFESERVHPVLFCGQDASDSDVAAFAAIDGITVIRSPIFNAAIRRGALLRALLTGIDSEVRVCLEQYRINVVFESATFYGWRFPLPIIAWFPDLQHKQMPELFPREGWWRREIGFRFQLAGGRCILLSSEAARQDLHRFYDRVDSRIEVLRFPARIVESDLQDDPCDLLATYELPRSFAFLPNQFWKHKNHAVVIEALGLLRKKGISIAVVATGNRNDHRYPGLYEQLEQRMRTLGVTEDFHMLGMVPRSHLIALLRTCSLLINPSRFEGWSTTVEEGKAFRIPMILSDLAVHREQAGDQANYFEADDAEKLASYLQIYMAAQPAQPRDLQVYSNILLADFASKFATIAMRCSEA